MASIETNAQRQQSFGAGVRNTADNFSSGGNSASETNKKKKNGTGNAGGSINDMINKLLGSVAPRATPVGQTPMAPNQPGTPAPIAPRSPNGNAQLPSDPVRAERGTRRPDYTLLEGVRNPGMGAGQAGQRANVLSAVYRLPADGSRGVRSLQSFNGPRGERLTLGR